MMVTLDFRKNYQEQTEEVKKAISEHDFYEVANLVGFKVRLKKMKKIRKRVDKHPRLWYYNYRKGKER